MGSSGNNSMEYQNISKVVGNNSEITITPVLNSSGAQHSLLQQHLQPHHLKELMSKASNERIKTEFINMVSYLVIYVVLLFIKWGYLFLGR